jgi:hypothetical protein
MADKMSDKCCYPSRYGGGWITAAQYLAENMCARMARKDSKDLPPLFWNTGAWKRTFLMQLRHANGLLKLYEVAVIVAALKRAKRVYSLGAKMILDPLFQEEQEKWDLQKQAREAAPPPPPPSPPPAASAKPRDVYNPQQSLLGKLRNLE